MTFSHLCAPDVHYERRFLLFYSIEQHLFVQKQQASRVSHFGTQVGGWGGEAAIPQARDGRQSDHVFGEARVVGGIFLSSELPEI